MSLLMEAKRNVPELNVEEVAPVRAHVKYAQTPEYEEVAPVRAHVKYAQIPERDE